MVTEDREDIYNVTCEDGNEISYVIRGLKSEDEVGPWSEFCASIFAYKENPPPPSYFERHYSKDPYREAVLIRVACLKDDNNTMVASCRLFLRTIASGSSSTTLSAGGIGEVCTDAKHRRRGLSKVLLQNVMDIMIDRKLQVSLLHAAPAFFPVYEKTGGYQNSISKWTVISLQNEIATANIAGYRIRKANFPNDTDQLSKLHQQYSEQRFSGCIVRTTDYWNNYLSNELQGSLWVLEQAEGNNIVAWLSIRSRGERYQLREFGVEEEQISCCKALTLLLSNAVKEQQATTSDKSWKALILPTFLLNQLRSEKDEALLLFDWLSEVAEDDLGWMYKILDETINIECLKGETRVPHLIWPADSF